MQTLCRRAQIGDVHVTLKGLSRQSAKLVRRLGHSGQCSIEGHLAVGLQLGLGLVATTSFLPRIVHRAVAATDAGVAALQPTPESGGILAESLIGGQKAVAGKSGRAAISVVLADAAAELAGAAQAEQL